MGACFHTQDVTCDNCRGFNINIGSGHGGTCNCRECQYTAYIPSVPMPQPVTITGAPVITDYREYLGLASQKERRERIATAILAAQQRFYRADRQTRVTRAIEEADALIAALDKETK